MNKSSTSDVWIDGVLYICAAMFIFSQGYLSTEEAYKYCNPLLLFWLKYVNGILAAGAGGLKAFRSMTFARHNGNMGDHKEPQTNTQNEKTNPTTGS